MNYFFPTPNGRVLSTQPFFNGNVLGATAQFLFLTGIKDPTLYLGLCDLQVRPGVFTNSLTENQNVSIDDYIALACLDKFAPSIVNWGRSHFGFFDCRGGLFPAPKSFLWRFAGFWTHAQIVGSPGIGAYDKWAWITAIEVAAQKPVTNQDGWIQSALMVKAYERSDVYDSGMDSAVEYWEQMKPKQIYEIMSDYIGDPNHPLVSAWEAHGI